MIKCAWNRFYSDFIMPSRLTSYNLLLQKALRKHYFICSIDQFWHLYKAGDFNPQGRYLILRHDIDTDVCTAKAMFRIEQQLGVSASYYFRLSTIDVPFMKEIHEAGGEASYHYEEVATYAKANRLRDPQEIYAKMKKIQELFTWNLDRLRAMTGLSMNIVASHGDFVNRYLRVPNHELLRNDRFRHRNGIQLEVYDSKIMGLVTSRHSDAPYPRFWTPDTPSKAIAEGARVVYVLTHPRHWRTNIGENIRDNFKRVIEGISYKL